MAIAPFPGRVQGPVERLAFNQRSGVVMIRGASRLPLPLAPADFRHSEFQRAARLGLRGPLGVHGRSVPAPRRICFRL